MKVPCTVLVDPSGNQDASPGAAFCSAFPRAYRSDDVAIRIGKKVCTKCTPSNPDWLV